MYYIIEKEETQEFVRELGDMTEEKAVKELEDSFGSLSTFDQKRYVYELITDLVGYENGSYTPIMTLDYGLYKDDYKALCQLYDYLGYSHCNIPEDKDNRVVISTFVELTGEDIHVWWYRDLAQNVAINTQTKDIYTKEECKEFRKYK